jgi:hypothetical protein
MFGMIAKLINDGAFHGRKWSCGWRSELGGGNEWVGDGRSGGESRVRCGRTRSAGMGCEPSGREFGVWTSSERSLGGSSGVPLRVEATGWGQGCGCCDSWFSNRERRGVSGGKTLSAMVHQTRINRYD